MRTTVIFPLAGNRFSWSKTRVLTLRILANMALMTCPRRRVGESDAVVVPLFSCLVYDGQGLALNPAPSVGISLPQLPPTSFLRNEATGLLSSGN